VIARPIFSLPISSSVPLTPQSTPPSRDPSTSALVLRSERVFTGLLGDLEDGSDSIRAGCREGAFVRTTMMCYRSLLKLHSAGYISPTLNFTSYNSIFGLPLPLPHAEAKFFCHDATLALLGTVFTKHCNFHRYYQYFDY
jgi:hypothetical protein